MIKQKCTTCEVTRYAVDKNSFPLNLVKMSVIFVNQNFILEVTWICYPIILAISWHFCSSFVRIYYPVRMYEKFSYYVRTTKKLKFESLRTIHKIPINIYTLFKIRACSLYEVHFQHLFYVQNPPLSVYLKYS